MKNKQEVILSLLRAMLGLMYKLTFVSRATTTDELEFSVRSVRKNLDKFENVFLKEKEDA